MKKITQAIRTALHSRYTPEENAYGDAYREYDRVLKAAGYDEEDEKVQAAAERVSEAFDRLEASRR